MTELHLDPVLEARLPLVRQLQAAGVPTTVDEVDGMLHGHLNVPGHPKALRSIDRMVAFLQTAVG